MKKLVVSVIAMFIAVGIFSESENSFAASLRLNSNMMGIIITKGIGLDLSAEYAFSSHFTTNLAGSFFGYKSTETGFPSNYLAFGLTSSLIYYIQKPINGLWFAGGIGAWLINYTLSGISYSNQFRLLLPLSLGCKLQLFDNIKLWIDPFMGISFSIASDTFGDSAVNTLTGYQFGIGIGYTF